MVLAAHPPVLPRVPRPADASRREIRPMRNCREAARIQPRQAHAPFRETIQVGRAHGHRRRAVEQIVVSERVGDYDNDIHRVFPSVVVVKRLECPVRPQWPPLPAPPNLPARPSSQTRRLASFLRAPKPRRSCEKYARSRRLCRVYAST